jgi:hydroxyacylglutathione hydrolase
VSSHRTIGRLAIDRFSVGPLETNCYLAWDQQLRSAVLIDPGSFTSQLADGIAAEALEVEWILDTHCHFDHTAGNSAAKEALGARLAIHELDLAGLEGMHISAASFMPGLDVPESPNPDRLLKDGDAVTLGGVELTVMHTPGHSPGSISLVRESVIFSGDTLFSGGVGRTDLTGGDWEALMQSLAALMRLPDETLVLPGHGPETTIGRERVTNPFVGEALAAIRG